MNRRDFLACAALIAAGTVAADQLELLDRLGWVRRFFPGFGPGVVPNPPGIVVTAAQWDALLKDVYAPAFMEAYSFSEMHSPLIDAFRRPKHLTEAPRRIWTVDA